MKRGKIQSVILTVVYPDETSEGFSIDIEGKDALVWNEKLIAKIAKDKKTKWGEKDSNGLLPVAMTVSGDDIKPIKPLSN